MTTNKKAKVAARRLKANSNLSYTAARRQATTPAGIDQDVAESLDSALARHVQQECYEFVGTSLGPLGSLPSGSLPGLEDARVRDLVPDISTIDIQEAVDDEEWDAITDVLDLFVDAELIVDGLMTRGDAAKSADAGLVVVVQQDSKPYASHLAVTYRQMIRLGFNAIVTSDAESVDGFNFFSAMPLP